MTDKNTLELTLEELKLIDKHLWISGAIKPILEKIKNAYPKPKSPVEEAYKEWWGQYPELETDSKYDDMRWQGFQAGYELAQLKDGCPEPEHYDEVVERLTKKYQAQKLYNRLFELGYSSLHCDEIVDTVEDWLPEPQNASGSQNVNTELLVDGFNHCLQKMKEMLR